VKRPLAVCVQVAYGHIDPVRLVEWLEFQRILGVSFVGVHLWKISAMFLAVFSGMRAAI